MSKVLAVASVALAIARMPETGPAAQAESAVCTHDRAPAMLVHVTGFKERRGSLRIQAYGGDPSGWFEKGRWIDRIDVPVPAGGPVDVCVTVPAAGRYAVSVRHDVDGDRKSGRSDGGGMSGNPQLGLTDLIFKRKPAADKVAVRVSQGATRVPVVLNYIQGTSFRPIAATGMR